MQEFRADVLVFSEIGMDPGNYMLAFSRLAPIQVATHGLLCEFSVFSLFDWLFLLFAFD